MSKTLKSTRITPYLPQPFPPRSVKLKTYAPLLEKANHSLETYRTILETSPLSEQLFAHFYTLEAMDSLESQHLSLTLAKFLTDKNNDPSAAQIRDYLRALKRASLSKAGSPFSRKEICLLHKIVKRSTAPKPDAGVYRNRQNWIGLSQCPIEEAYFYPPAASHVPLMMKQLFKYCKRKTEEPLFQLALIFAQLLIIHPFMDGNGRVCRLWIPLFLHQKKILPVPFFFMSGYFNRHRLKYFQTLFKTTNENCWNDWIVFFLKGIIIQSKKYCRAMSLILKMEDRLHTEFPGLNQKERLFLFQNPIFTQGSWKKAGNPSVVLQELEKNRWIRGSKNQTFRFVPLLKVLQSLYTK